MAWHAITTVSLDMFCQVDFNFDTEDYMDTRT